MDGFDVIDLGYANPDFTRFSIVEDNNLASPAGQIRLRIFSKALSASLLSAVFNDYDGGAGDVFSGNGGQFSEDGDYVLLTYLSDADPNNLTTTIRVLDSSNLAQVASTTIPGGSLGLNSYNWVSKAMLLLRLMRPTQTVGFLKRKLRRVAA